MRSAIGFVWPPRSLVTGERHSGDGAIPADDFARLRFLSAAGCRRCALPLEVDLGEASLCARWAAKPPRWQAARAAIAYDDHSRQIVLDLKHAARRDGLAIVGNWLALAGQDILQETDILTPVPLHYRRLVARGYNQSAWLAREIAAWTGVRHCVDVLKRKRPTRSQGGLSGRQRRRNVAGAFAVRRSRRKQVQGAVVTLVDDVYTTGSTLSACTRALQQAGARRVNVLVLARVVRDEDVTI